MADRRRLMKAMGDWRPYEVPPGLTAALETGSESYRRYALDVACELQYQDFRQGLMKQAEAILGQLRLASTEDSFMGDLLAIKRSPDKPKDLEKTVNSHTAWRLIRALAELDAAYGAGDTDGACAAIAEVAGSATSAEARRGVRRKRVLHVSRPGVTDKTAESPKFPSAERDAVRTLKNDP